MTPFEQAIHYAIINLQNALEAHQRGHGLETDQQLYKAVTHISTGQRIRIVEQQGIAVRGEGVLGE